MKSPRLLPLLFLAGWVALALGLAADARRGGPEITIRTYLRDLEAHAIERSLAPLTPAAVVHWEDFVAFQQFNRYDVVSVVSRSPSILESIGTGAPWQATQATLVVDVTEPSGLTWRGSTVVPVHWADSRWWIERPPFAPV